MNFYFSLFQLIETVDRLDRDVTHLSGRALRISPRDARANRDLLEQCEAKMSEVKNLLNNKTHISKITLRKAALLFQILDLFYRRVIHLAEATSNIGHDDEGSVKAVWQLLSQAERHYRTLVKTLHELTGIPVAVNVLTGAEDPSSNNFGAILSREVGYQQESLKLLEKAIEVFGEEQALADQLSQIRKDLLETKKRMKHMAGSHSSYAKASEDRPAERSEMGIRQTYASQAPKVSQEKVTSVPQAPAVKP